MDENLEEQLAGEPQEQPEGPQEQAEAPEGPQPEEAQEPQSEEPQRRSPDSAPAKRDPSAGLDMYLNVRVLVSMMAVFVLLFTFVARIIVVSGPSMENTLLGGDLILVWSLGYTPKQGDIVVLTQESYQEDSIVKRVIATEGQRVEIDYSTGTVEVDGTPLEEDYIKEQMRTPSYGPGLTDVTVPEGCIFVMGDNRNHSADSRYPDIGVVDTRCVIGHGVAVVFPVDRWTGL